MSVYCALCGARITGEEVVRVDGSTYCSEC